MPTEGHFSRCVTRRAFLRPEKAFGAQKRILGLPVGEIGPRKGVLTREKCIGDPKDIRGLRKNGKMRLTKGIWAKKVLEGSKKGALGLKRC